MSDWHTGTPPEHAIVTALLLHAWDRHPALAVSASVIYHDGRWWLVWRGDNRSVPRRRCA